MKGFLEKFLSNLMLDIIKWDTISYLEDLELAARFVMDYKNIPIEDWSIPMQMLLNREVPISDILDDLKSACLAEELENAGNPFS